MSPYKARHSANPKFLLPIFANRFLRKLAAIRFTKRRHTAMARARRIKRAADISLASAAASCNPKSAWSRAIVQRRRTRAVVRSHKNTRLRQKRHAAAIPEENVGSRTALLRRLVPGGGGLDFCRLLEEAADYIKSLNIQVQVMQRIADSVSA